MRYPCCSTPARRVRSLRSLQRTCLFLLVSAPIRRCHRCQWRRQGGPDRCKLERENTVYPGIPEALRELGGRTDLYVATSKPAVFARRILEHFNLARLFKGIHGSELDGARSDKGELIAHVLRAEGLDPAATLMVGDRKHDLLGAAQCGVRGVGALWGYGGRAELEAAGAWRLLDAPAELAGLVRG